MPTNRTKRRLANKTIWALEDIIASCRIARRAIDDAQARVQELMDPLILKHLLTISTNLAEIETKARDARQGKYNE